MKTKVEELEEKYLKNNGSICPVCDSSNITAGDIDKGSDIIWQVVTCNGCGSRWDETYELKSITFINFEIDIVQHLDVAVVGIHIFKFDYGNFSHFVSNPVY